jgi:hypothetical protein
MSADPSSNPSQDLADGLATLTDEERAALEEDVDDLKRDDSDLGEDDDDEQDDASAEDDTPPVEGKAAKVDPVADDPAPAAQAEPATQVEDEPDPDAKPVRTPLFKAELPADFEARKQALQTREEEAEQKYDDGEIDRATLRATLREVAAERDELTRIQVKAEIANELVQQEAATELQTAVNAVMKLGEAAGVDYKDDARWNELKAFVNVVEARHPGKSAAWVLQEAHKKVLVANDIAPTKTNSEVPKPKVDPKADALAKRKVDAGKVQPNLSQVPGGDGPGDVGSEFADIDALDGERYEAALERLRKSNPVAYEKYMAES